MSKKASVRILDVDKQQVEIVRFESVQEADEAAREARKSRRCGFHLITVCHDDIEGTLGVF